MGICVRGNNIDVNKKQLSQQERYVTKRRGRRPSKRRAGTRQNKNTCSKSSLRKPQRRQSLDQAKSSRQAVFRRGFTRRRTNINRKKCRFGSNQRGRKDRQKDSDSSSESSMETDSDSEDDSRSEDGFSTAESTQNIARSNIFRPIHTAESSTQTNIRHRQSNHGRRGRQRQKARRQRQHQQTLDDSHYFPDENDPWVPNAANHHIPFGNHAGRPSQNNQFAPLSPLVQNNLGHSMAWDNNDFRVIVQPIPQGFQSFPSDYDPDSRYDRVNRMNAPPPTFPPQPSTRRGIEIPNGSQTDMDFNLAQRLRERNRPPAASDIAAHQASSYVAARAARAASRPQTQHSSQSLLALNNHRNGLTISNQGNSQRVNRPENAAIHWDTSSSSPVVTYSPSDNDNWLSDGYNSRRVNGRSRQKYRQRGRRRNNRNRDEVIAQLHGRENHDLNVTAAQNINAAESRGWFISATDLVDQGHRASAISGRAPSTSSGITSSVPQRINQEDTQSDANPYARYDAAYRRQEERNEWRNRQRRRRNRQDRRNMEQRRQQRQGYVPASSSTTSVNTQRSRHNAWQNEESTTLQHTAWRLQHVEQTPRLQSPTSSLQQENSTLARTRQDATQNGSQHNESEVHSDRSQETIGTQSQNEQRERLPHESLGALEDNQEQIMEADLLRNYQDPVESSSPLGIFLQQVTAQGRVIVSRVRKRVTKQYFRRGDFQAALADFRSLNPDHTRQVLGVGFTGTVDNMYRLTVKQNSSFGKPTFEIRPMNKRIRKRLLHVCYKIRYFSKQTPRMPPPPPPLPPNPQMWTQSVAPAG